MTPGRFRNITLQDMKTSKQLYPQVITVELTTRCNGKCVYCVRDKFIPKSIDFDLGTYKQLIDSLPNVKTVFPVSFGESLLYPYIIQAIAYARAKDKKVILVTNGSLLSDVVCNELLLADLSQLRISVDADNAKMYNILRPGLDFNTLVENVKCLVKTKQKLGSVCKIIARITRTKENQKNIQQIKSFWSSLGCIPIARNEIDIPKVTDKKYSNKDQIACKWPLRTLTVKANGDVALCCKDWYGWYISGNVYRDNVLDAFNSDKFRKIRHSMASGKNYPAICDICTNEHRRHK